MYWYFMIGFILLINKSLTCTIPTFSNLTVQSNFNLHQFLGIWYEIKWLSSESSNQSSIWYDYSQSFELENNSSQNLLVYGKARLIHEEQCFSFGPWLIITNNSAKMILEKKDLSDPINLNWPFYILKTDYEHYALIYACILKNSTNNDNHLCDDPIVWVFSRTRILSNEYIIQLDDYIENILCFNLTKFEITLYNEKSCYTLLSLGTKIFSMNSIWFLILFIFIFYF